MRIIFAMVALFWANSAAAHPGHIEWIAGHDHWVGGAAIGIAILIGIAGALTGKGKPKDAGDDVSEEEEVPA